MQGEPLHNYDSVLASIDILAEVRTLSRMVMSSLKKGGSLNRGEGGAIEA